MTVAEAKRARRKALVVEAGRLGIGAPHYYLTPDLRAEVVARLERLLDEDREPIAVVKQRRWPNR